MQGRGSSLKKSIGGNGGRKFIRKYGFRADILEECSTQTGKKAFLSTSVRGTAGPNCMTGFSPGAAASSCQALGSLSGGQHGPWFCEPQGQKRQSTGAVVWGLWGWVSPTREAAEEGRLWMFQKLWDFDYSQEQNRSISLIGLHSLFLIFPLKFTF